MTYSIHELTENVQHTRYLHRFRPYKSQHGEGEVDRHKVPPPAEELFAGKGKVSLLQ